MGRNGRGKVCVIAAGLLWPGAVGAAGGGPAPERPGGARTATESRAIARTEGVTIFDDQAAFLAAAGQVLTEGFEDEAPVGTGNSGGVASLAFDDFSATAVPAALKILDVPWVGNHNTTPLGKQYLSGDTDTLMASADLTLTFASPIHNLGMFLVDLDAFDAEVTINGATYIIPAHGDGGESYFGILSDVEFTEVAVGSTGGDNHYSLDDLAYGDPCLPVADLMANSVLIRIGDRLQTRLELTNACAGATPVEIKLWLKAPGGFLTPLQDPHLTVQLAAGAAAGVEVLDHTFGGLEPPGSYEIGARLIDPATGAGISEEVIAVEFAP